MRELTAFLERLDRANVSYFLGHYSVGTSNPRITVHVTASANERWEVEFFADDHVEIERFFSEGVDEGDADLEALGRELELDNR